MIQYSELTPKKTPVDTEHAFLKPDFLLFLEKNFPELIDRVKSSTFPKISESPNDLEQWESELILKRKQKMEIESNWAYLARLLYEETFSVNQNPDFTNPPMKMDMCGVTAGGLISHFMFRGSTNGVTLESIVEQISQYTFSSLKEFIADFKKHNPDNYLNKLSDVLDVIIKCVENGSIMPRRFPLNLKKELIENSNENKSYGAFESIGFRLLAMLCAEPEMLNEVVDENLKTRFKLNPNAEISRAELIIHAWYKSQAILTKTGTFAYTDQENVKEAIKNLLYLRTHPEMQVFYKFLSPSGYINEKYQKNN